MYNVYMYVFRCVVVGGFTCGPCLASIDGFGKIPVFVVWEGKISDL